MPGPAPSPVSSAAPAPPASPALGLRLRGYALDQLRGAARALAAGNTHEGVHEFRKGIRRARAVLALGRRTFGERGQRLDRDLRALGRGLSRLRDAHALVELLADRDLAAPPPLAVQLPRLQLQAQLRRDRLLLDAFARDPDFARRRSRLDALASRMERLDWADLDGQEVAGAVARCTRRAGKAGRRALAHPDRDAAWHAYRRRTRRLRQLDAALAEIDAARRPPHHGLRELAAELGRAQDAALLLAACGTRSPFPARARRELRAFARERLQAARRARSIEGDGRG